MVYHNGFLRVGDIPSIKNYEYVVDSQCERISALLNEDIDIDFSENIKNCLGEIKGVTNPGILIVYDMMRNMIYFVRDEKNDFPCERKNGIIYRFWSDDIISFRFDNKPQEINLNSAVKVDVSNGRVIDEWEWRKKSSSKTKNQKINNSYSHSYYNWKEELEKISFSIYDIDEEIRALEKLGFKWSNDELVDDNDNQYNYDLSGNKWECEGLTIKEEKFEDD